MVGVCRRRVLAVVTAVAAVLLVAQPAEAYVEVAYSPRGIWMYERENTHQGEVRATLVLENLRAGEARLLRGESKVSQGTPDRNAVGQKITCGRRAGPSAQETLGWHQPPGPQRSHHHRRAAAFRRTVCRHLGLSPADLHRLPTRRPSPVGSGWRAPFLGDVLGAGPAGERAVSAPDRRRGVLPGLGHHHADRPPDRRAPPTAGRRHPPDRARRCVHDQLLRARGRGVSPRVVPGHWFDDVPGAGLAPAQHTRPVPARPPRPSCGRSTTSRTMPARPWTSPLRSPAVSTAARGRAGSPRGGSPDCPSWSSSIPTRTPPWSAAEARAGRPRIGVAEDGHLRWSHDVDDRPGHQARAARRPARLLRRASTAPS